jgi:lysosomal acid lipase/cholesteryl ester hydrolase
MDQFAFHDIPDSIDYILQATGQKSLSYIGFSQGTAQAFATLSIHPVLNDKVDVFVALAPAMSPAGLSPGIVNSLIKASPEVVFLAFGRRSILSSAAMWQSILYPPIFIRLIDMSLSLLFGWHGRNISTHQKLAAYPHLYSFTSTKSVVHWFQIIRTKSFQMYDDAVQAPFSLSASDRYYKVAKFPTRNIKTPVVLMYGGSDSLVDINVMLKELPRHTVAKEIPHFEHLDFLWAQEVDTLVFPYVFAALDEYAGRDHHKDTRFRYSNVKGGHSSPLAQWSDFSEDDSSTTNSAFDSNGPPARLRIANERSSLATPSPKMLQQASPLRLSTDHSTISTDPSGDLPSPTAVSPVALLKNSTKQKRSGSLSSSHSLENLVGRRRFGESGISLGASKATVSVAAIPKVAGSKRNSIAEEQDHSS